MEPTGRAALLDPSAFTSLGASPFASGTYTIDASKDNAAPTLSGLGITTPIAGVFHSPSGGSVANDEIAVFTFDSIDIPAGVTVRGAQNANSRPIALLSQDIVTLRGLVEAGGAGGSEFSGFNINVGGAGGAAGPGGGGGGGGGGGEGDEGIPDGRGGSGGAGFVSGSAGADSSGSTNARGGDGGDVGANGGGTGAGSAADGGGGAYGGNGGSGRDGGAGGTAYGDLSVRLQGGSGGGGGGGSGASGAGGGGGGGAVEVGAVAALTVMGDVHANGGNGGRYFREGGGGAGGGILLHGSAVTLGCSAGLSAAGGSGSSDGNGGGGGGGRVHIVAATTITGDPTTSVNVLGGPSNLGEPGATGVLTMAGSLEPLPALTLSPTTLPDGRVGLSYSQTITAADGTAPYTFTVTGLPAGLTPSATSPSVALSGTPTESGSFSVSVTAQDDLGCAVSQTYPLTIIADTTPPVITPTVTGTLGTNGWYTSNVAVSWSVVDNESTITSTSGCQETVITTDTAGTGTTLTCQATSAGGANSQSVTIKRDATAPTLSCTAASPGPLFVVGGPGGNVGAGVTDATSGPLASPVSAPANVASVGNKQVSLTGEDRAGNTAAVTCPYRVGYKFLGFLSPIPKSSYKVGSTIPAKFTLGDNAGTKIPDAVAQALVASCKVKVGLDTATGCASYNASSDTFQFDVKVPKNTSAGSHQNPRGDLRPQRLGPRQRRERGSHHPPLSGAGRQGRRPPGAAFCAQKLGSDPVGRVSGFIA